MAKPAKPQFGTNGVPPSSKLSQLADLADYGANMPAVIATRVATQAMTTSVLLNVALDTEVFDPLGMFTVGSTTITISDSGVWLVSGWCKIQSNTSGMRSLEIYQNGASVLDESGSAPSSFEARFSLSNLFLCQPGDTFGLVAFQNSGGALNLVGARLSAVRVSGT